MVSDVCACVRVLDLLSLRFRADLSRTVGRSRLRNLVQQPQASPVRAQFNFDVLSLLEERIGPQGTPAAAAGKSGPAANAVAPNLTDRANAIVTGEKAKQSVGVLWQNVSGCRPPLSITARCVFCVCVVVLQLVYRASSPPPPS